MAVFTVGGDSMTNEEFDEIECRVLTALRHEMPIELHTTHHTWVAIQMKKELTIIKRNEAITQHVIGWGIIAFITGLGAVVWHWFESKTSG